MNKYRLTFLLSVALIGIPISLVWIGGAYGANLTGLGVITPEGTFQVQFDASKRKGDMATVMRIAPFGKGMGSSDFAGPLVFKSETFMPNWLRTVKQNTHSLLWSSYPASIRGQVFGNGAPGGNPMVTQGW